MRFFNFFITSFSVLVISISGCYAQNNIKDNEAIEMIKDFYTAYGTITFTVKDFHKLDLIQQRYCSEKLRKKAKEYSEDGYDLLTNDYGIDKKYLKSLNITKDSTKINTYIVTYIVDTYPVSPNKPIKKRVNLHITVVKEREVYKIASVS